MCPRFAGCVRGVHVGRLPPGVRAKKYPFDPQTEPFMRVSFQDSLINKQTRHKRPSGAQNPAFLVLGRQEGRGDCFDPPLSHGPIARVAVALFWLASRDKPKWAPHGA